MSFARVSFAYGESLSSIYKDASVQRAELPRCSQNAPAPTRTETCIRRWGARPWWRWRYEVKNVGNAGFRPPQCAEYETNPAFEVMAGLWPAIQARRARIAPPPTLQPKVATMT